MRLQIIFNEDVRLKCQQIACLPCFIVYTGTTINANPQFGPKQREKAEIEYKGEKLAKSDD